MRRRAKIYLAITVGMLAFSGVWAAWVYTLGQNNVDAYKKSLLARGEKLEISEVLPPPIPPDQNGADFVNQAGVLFNPEPGDFTNSLQAMRMVAPGKAMAVFQQPYVLSREFSNSWDSVLAVEAYNRPGTDLLRHLLDTPALDFHLDYQGGQGIQLRHLQPLRRCAQKLSAEAVCDLHNGDAALATTNICVLLALVNGEHDERLVVSQATRTMLALFATQATWELLQSSNVNDAELAMLQTKWEQQEYVRAMENAILMQRAMSEDDIAKMRNSRTDLKKIMSSGPGYLPGWTGRFIGAWDGAKRTYGELMWRISWTYSDELQMLQNYQLVLDTVRTIETNGYFNPAYTNMVNQLQSVVLTNQLSDMADYQWAFSQGSGNVGEALGRTMTVEAARQIVIAAIALKRYQVKYGNYPSDLKSLAPEFVSAIPKDPVDGKPLRYRLMPDGTCLLYSIGPNSTDDGGDPALAFGSAAPSGRGFGGGMGFFGFFSWINLRSQDWVWPQPATPDEIENFYERGGRVFAP
jgi:hypothetical protein